MSQYIWQNRNWKQFNWDDQKILPIISKLRLRQGKLINKIQFLRQNETIFAQSEILITETIKTAQIEGEIYDLASVRSSVHRRLGLSDVGISGLKRDVDGLVQVLLDATTNYQQKLNVKKLKAWHAAMFPTGYSGLKKIRVGKFRDDLLGPMQVVFGAIGREKVHYQAPSANNLTQEMNDFLAWWQASSKQIDGIIRAAIAHFYFVTIHPFEDGNGRLTRVLTDMALAADDQLPIRYYSLSDQILKDKKRYYQILEQTQKSDTSNITEWLIWFADCFDQSLRNANNLLQNVFAKARFWHEHRDVELNSRQKKVINKLLDVGAGNFQGGLTTRKYVHLTKISRATAYREITDLVVKKILHPNEDEGRSTSYDLNISE